MNGDHLDLLGLPRHLIENNPDKFNNNCFCEAKSHADGFMALAYRALLQFDGKPWSETLFLRLLYFLCCISPSFYLTTAITLRCLAIFCVRWNSHLANRNKIEHSFMAVQLMNEAIALDSKWLQSVPAIAQLRFVVRTYFIRWTGICEPIYSFIHPLIYL